MVRYRVDHYVKQEAPALYAVAINKASKERFEDIYLKLRLHDRTATLKHILVIALEHGIKMLKKHHMYGIRDIYATMTRGKRYTGELPRIADTCKIKLPLSESSIEELQLLSEAGLESETMAVIPTWRITDMIFRAAADILSYAVINEIGDIKTILKTVRKDVVVKKHRPRRFFYDPIIGKELPATSEVLALYADLADNYVNLEPVKKRKEKVNVIEEF